MLPILVTFTEFKRRILNKFMNKKKSIQSYSVLSLEQMPEGYNSVYMNAI